MSVPKKLGPGQRIDQDWKTIDSIIDFLESMQNCTSSHPQFIQVKLNAGGFVFDFTGLVTALKAAGVPLQV